MTFTVVFESGANDSRWCLEADETGNLYASSNAETRTRIDGRRHLGQPRASVGADFRDAGVPEAIIERYLDQAELVND